MSDAAIDRLAKIISDSPRNHPDDKKSGKPLYEIHLGLAEGWFSLILLAIVVYSTIWCVQAVGWVAHLNILTLTTALGLIIGMVAAKQHRVPRLSVHVLSIAFGLLLAFWQTAGAFYQGNLGALATGMHHWLLTLLDGGTSSDDSIFLFFIVALGFILAYTSAWLVYRTRSPWLMIGANAFVLLINLNNAPDGYILFLIVFLMASLLLLLRFNLYESIQRWRRQGLRYADDIGWDIMQAGAMISVGILILSWLLPGGYVNATTAQIWDTNSNPWVQLENTWNRVISVSGGENPSNHGNFTDSLVLGGNPNLNHDIVMTVQSTDGSQYLGSLSYSTYDGRGWTNGPTQDYSLKPNDTYPSGAVQTHTIQQSISIVNPPGEQAPYVLGAPDLLSANMSTRVRVSKASGDVTAWLNQNGNLTAGTHYTVTSSVSSADEQTLRSVPMPNNAPIYPSNYDGPISPDTYDPNVLKTYLQLPSNLDPQIAALVRQITAKAPTMYDKAVALETYLRTNYTYSLDVRLPSGQEGVSWFLFRSGNKGYCNYFATAMAVMARIAGIPARVVAGYTNGTYDATHHDHVIRGTDAHAWTQVYFAGYGWINFEPSASFSMFNRPLPNQFVGASSSNGSANANSSTTSPNLKGRLRNELGNQAGNAATTPTPAQVQAQVRQQVGMALGSVVLLLLFGLLLFGLWWRRLFRRYDLSSQLYGRICVLANMAGMQIQPSQTPYEYIHGIAASAPEDALTIERLGDIYVRDKWADPNSSEHPMRSGEIQELPSLWRRLQPRLFLHVLRHPSFLSWLPHRLWVTLLALLKRRRAHKLSEQEL